MQFQLKASVDIWLFDCVPVFSVPFEPPLIQVQAMQGLQTVDIHEVVILRGQVDLIDIGVKFDLLNPSQCAIDLQRVAFELHLDHTMMDDYEQDENGDDDDREIDSCIGKVTVDELSLVPGWNTLSARVQFYPAP